MIFNNLTVLFSVLALIQLAVINIRRKKYKNILTTQKRLLSVPEPFDITRLEKQPKFGTKFILPAVLFFIFGVAAVVLFLLAVYFK